MPANILWIGGSKGGVGKSLVAMAALDLLLGRGDRVTLVETDTSNPDVWKAYGEHVPSALVDLDDREGWIELLNLCHAEPDTALLINTAARNAEGVKSHGPLLRDALDELRRRLVTLWVINRQRDSLVLLRAYMDVMPAAANHAVHVLRNGYFGDGEKFQLYNNAKLRKAVESAGGQSLTFPDLADRVADEIFSRRLAIPAALEDLPFGNRAELLRWRREVAKTLGPVI